MFKGNFWNTFGPGILFASTAIGVSHLVQSTRAGASYGYALVWAVVLANFFKYPFFEFGSRFAQATGQNLLEGYKMLGKWTLWLYLLITVLSMFTVTGAVSFVTTALLANMLGLSATDSFIWVAAGIYIFCISLLLIGKYKVLDRFIKIIAVLLIVSTLLAFFLVLMNNPVHAETPLLPSIFDDKTHWIFIIALMGWMPTAVDLSAWNSIWTIERIKESGYKPTLKQTLTEFRIGYLVSAILALVFLVLGAELMFYQGQSFPNEANGFTEKLISLFTGSLGAWSYPIIALAAFSVMLSTTLTIFDGYARALTETINLLGLKERRNNYSFYLIITGIGGLLVITVFKNQLKDLVDVATIISFLVAPVVAYLNYKLLFSAHTPKVAQPKKLLKLWALSGLAFLLLFSLVFLWITIS